MAQANSTEGAMEDHAVGTLRKYLRGEAGDFALVIWRSHRGFIVNLADPATLDNKIAEALTFTAAWLGLAPPVFIRPEERPIVIHDKGRDPDWLDKTSALPLLDTSLSPEDQVVDLLRRDPGDRFTLTIMLRQRSWLVQFSGYNDTGAKEIYGRTFAEAWNGRWHPHGPYQFKSSQGEKV